MGDNEKRADRLATALTDPGLEHMVEMVLRREGTQYEARSSSGSIRFEHDADGTRVLETSGVDPFDAAPHAHDEVAQFFDSPHAPDLAVVHTAAHRFHGNIGEHGALNVTQRRAPFIVAGAGVLAEGWIDGHGRTVDVAPTVAALAGVEPIRGIGRFGEPEQDRYLVRQDGEVLDPVDGSADHVVLVLWDGCNADALRSVIDAGEAPNAAGLVARGTGFEGGLLASFPSATLANHTTIGTGAMPGHSGVLHNEWRCGLTGEHRNLLDIEQMFDACTHLDPGVETLHEAVKRTFPDAWTGSTHEFCDRGADFSSFRAMARRERLPFARSDEAFPRDGHWWETSARYQFMTRVDETSLRCALDFWSDDHPLPRFAFCSFALTDEAGHEGGPDSEECRAAIRDCDERLGRLLGAIEQRGVLDQTAIVLVADHGMQATSDLTDDWTEAVAGIDHVSIDDMFLYV